uniref:protein TIC 22, chloroplastic isoform X2 n=1 Tax=Erigeron canadensis TaxID=72917 RepID=UPI001CB8977B|nr:protein TIC 22, chloroplastic isoform X2 [Erigeron canadensis]
MILLVMEKPNTPCSSPAAAAASSPNPFTFFHHHFLRLHSHITTRLDDTRRSITKNIIQQLHQHNHSSSLPLASLSQQQQQQDNNKNSNNIVGGGGVGKHVFDVALSTANVSKTLAGTELYTVSNSDNEFVLISDPNGLKSIGLLCFRQEDAESFLAQVRLRKGELRGRAKVVPISLDQVYMLKVEGIAFRFLPDPVQLKNAMELKASTTNSGFDGVPVFQSDLLVIRKKNRRYCPIYFRKEDIEKELLMVPRGPRGPGISQHIMVGSLEDVLKKMEMSEKNSGWEDLIFIPPGKSHSQHLQEVVNA